MAQTRYYSSTAQPTVLVNTITPTTTTIQLQQVIGFPINTPFVIALDYNTAGEELALVTLVAGTTLTITRAFDGTSAASHNVGAGVRHVSCAVDFNDSRLHESLSAGIHGVTGSVVGTTDIQTLTNKTISGLNLNGVVNGTPTWSSSQNFGNGATFTNGFNAGSTNQLAVDSSGDINTSGTLTAGGSALNAVNVTTSATVGTTLGVTGASTLTGRVNSSGANILTAAYVESNQAGTANTSSTTYVDVGTTVSTTIVVPASGKVLIMGRAAAFNGTANVSVWSTVNVVGSVSGTLRASVDTKAIEVRINGNMANTDLPVHESFVQTAAAGETLTIKWQHRTTGGTAGIDYRSLSAIPLLG